MMRLSAWVGYKIGEAVWWLLHEVMGLESPDPDDWR